MCSSDIINTVANPFNENTMKAWDDVTKGDQAFRDICKRLKITPARSVRLHGINRAFFVKKYFCEFV